MIPLSDDAWEADDAAVGSIAANPAPVAELNHRRRVSVLVELSGL